MFAPRLTETIGQDGCQTSGLEPRLSRPGVNQNPACLVTQISPALPTLLIGPKERRTGLTKRAFLALFFTAVVTSAAEAFGQSAKPCAVRDASAVASRLHIVVSGVRRAAGNVTFTLYGENPALFLKPHGSIALTRTAVSSSVVEGCFAVTLPGDYAVAVYHDENDNHHFDKNFLGLPAEGYGFSNDAPTFLGPPSFAAARIGVHPGDNRILIRLRY